MKIGIELRTQHSVPGTPYSLGRIFLLALLFSAALTPQLAQSAPTSARREVREGLRQHAAGEFAAAAESFAKAAEQLPEDPRVVYDQACALAAQRKRAEATSLDGDGPEQVYWLSDLHDRMQATLDP